ncbi:MAG: DUF98 domain-containing protein [Chromatiales bacterium]|nr:MAG: DUF98 domain-containing protein [Chromatiales bacterium]
MQARPQALGDVELDNLSAFQRALLTIDGTVTQFIEAYTLEKVRIRVLDHSAGCAGDLASWLACDSDTEVLRRRAALVGSDTERLYVYAESVLLPARLSTDMHAALNRETGGLGKILLNELLESRREGLWYGMQELRKLPPALGVGASLYCLTRTYRVISGGQPLMLITEHFPAA